MGTVTCSRCGEVKPRLENAPLPGEWGAAVQAEVCADCWRAWTEEQTRLINHLGLQPFKPADKRVLYRHLHTFLNLRGVAAPAD